MQVVRSFLGISYSFILLGDWFSRLSSVHYLTKEGNFLSKLAGIEDHKHFR
jgi:hypothetical protein